MGYYTSHKLEIIEGNDNVTDYKAEIAEISGYSDPFDDNIKWYSHQKDMREYSKRHPKTVFELTGTGEEPDDMWIEYYLNGKMQRTVAKIIFDDYDQNKLE
jgi:hypothetical protein